jgi:hypothetical protein
MWSPIFCLGALTRFQMGPASPQASPSTALWLPTPRQALAHKVRQGMYFPMLHMDSSLGADTKIGGALPTLQAFF